MFVGDQDIDYAQQAAEAQVLRLAARAAYGRFALDADSGGGELAGGNYPANAFWLEPVSVVGNPVSAGSTPGAMSSNLFNVILHGTTNGSTYLITSTETLNPLTNNVWRVEGSLQGGTNDATPFALGVATRTNSLFIRAQACDECATTALPLWWQLAYFGVTAVDPNADYDGDGVTNLTEYLNPTDPNKIRFSLSVTNQYVTTTTVPVQLNIAGGVPSYIALLLNDPNATNANWQPFTSTNLSVSTPTNGVYVFTVGLRGLPTNAVETWHSATLTRDATPLTLVLTNLAARSGSRPFIDPAGYATRALRAITWTVVDANGATNRGSGTVAAQSWNLLDPYHVTNWFQCLDLGLALGTNWVSIQAADWAGAVAVTNFTYMFNTNGDTTAPALTLLWPQNGTLVSGDTFTVQAWTDDDTAAVALHYTDTNGMVQTINGLVERGGNVWVQSVPLAAGTNSLTITATDAAGNMSTTHFSVVRSTVVFTVNPLSQDNLKYGYATVSGALDAPNCPVTVNGVQGTNDGGSWTVDNVSLPPGGTVTLQATAHLSGGLTLQTLLEQIRDPIVFTQTYGYKLDYTTLDSSLSETNFNTYHIEVEWARGAGGTWTVASSETNAQTPNVTSNVTVTVWPPDNGYWPSLPGQAVTSAYLNGALLSSSTSTVPAPSVEWMEQSATAGSVPLDALQVTYSEASGREVRLFTGDKSTRQSQGLFDLSAALTVESEFDPFVAFWTDTHQGFTSFLEPASPPVAVPSEQISLGALGNLGGGGSLQTVKPNGVQIVVTPKAPGRYLGALPAVKKWQLLSQTVSATPTNRARTTLGVGEEVDVYLYSPYYDLPANWSTNVSWTTTAGSVYPQTGGSTRLTAPSNAAPATVTMHYNTMAFTADFDVVEPKNVVRADIVSPWCYTPGQAGAGMQIRPFVGPTNVSFYRVQLMEVGEPASDVQDYFLDPAHPAPPHDYSAGADHFDIQLGYDNSWPGGYDKAFSAVFPPSTSNPVTWAPGGGFTWHVGAKWKIGSGRTNDLSGSWNQVFGLLPDGTVTVSKFKYTATRHVNQNCSVIANSP